MPVHIRNKAKEYIPVLRKIGFNNVRMFAAVEGTEEPEDDQTMEEAAAWHERYVMIVVEPHFRYQDEEQYVKLDEEQFWEDFLEHLKKNIFGEDVSIEHCEHTGEIEIIRESGTNGN